MTPKPTPKFHAPKPRMIGTRLAGQVVHDHPGQSEQQHDRHQDRVPAADSAPAPCSRSQWIAPAASRRRASCEPWTWARPSPATLLRLAVAFAAAGTVGAVSVDGGRARGCGVGLGQVGGRGCGWPGILAIRAPGARRTPRGTRRRGQAPGREPANVLWRVLVPVVCLVAGFVFATSAHDSRGTDLRPPGIANLRDLVVSAEQRVHAA